MLATGKAHVRPVALTDPWGPEACIPRGSPLGPPKTPKPPLLRGLRFYCVGGRAPRRASARRDSPDVPATKSGSGPQDLEPPDTDHSLSQLLVGSPGVSNAAHNPTRRRVRFVGCYLSPTHDRRLPTEQIVPAEVRDAAARIAQASAHAPMSPDRNHQRSARDRARCEVRRQQDGKLSAARADLLDG